MELRRNTKATTPHEFSDGSPARAGGARMVGTFLSGIRSALLLSPRTGQPTTPLSLAMKGGQSMRRILAAVVSLAALVLGSGAGSNGF